MFSKVGKRFSYANVTATLALVFAMTGGAYAASKFIVTSTKQIKPSVLKQLQGKDGKTGPQGPVGLQGAPGTNGKDGTSGKDGTNGASGATGKSVIAANEPKGAHCGEGGSSFEVEGSGAKHYACNGSPWSVGGKLPEGSSERGQWIMSYSSEVAFHDTAVSFPIPLAAALSEADVHVIGVEEGFKEAKESSAIKSGQCSGTWENTETAPIKAQSKNLCIFVSPGGSAETLTGTESAESASSGGAGVSGVVLTAGIGTGPFILKGSWVVTG